MTPKVKQQIFAGIAHIQLSHFKFSLSSFSYSYSITAALHNQRTISYLADNAESP
jgi:hypothetical protein